MRKKIKISTWNINGINSFIKKDSFQTYINRSNNPPDILCLSEIRTNYKHLETKNYYINEFKINDKNHFKKFIFNCSKHFNGYSGTAILSKYNYLNYDFYENIDDESRMISVEYDLFIILNLYVPFTGDKKYRLPYRMNKFNYNLDRTIEDLLNRGKPLIIVGDLNVAHKDSDVHSLLEMLPGCSIEEREWFSNFLNKFDLVDTFRHLNQNSLKYSYFSNRTKNNSIFKAGMRLDYILVSKPLIKNVIYCDILDEIRGSDHCPVEMIITI